MATINPHFNDDERCLLQQQHGLTKQQMYVLERHLGVILDRLGPHERMKDVRSALRSLSAEITKASRRVTRWANATRQLHGPEALGWLNVAGAAFESAPTRPDDGTWPQQIVASDLIHLLAVIAEKAVKDFEKERGRSVPTSSSPRAVERILWCLCHPADGASKVSAAALVPSRTVGKRNAPSFRAVADIVWTACYRALPRDSSRPDDQNKGRPSDKKAKMPNAATSIREYLKQLPKHKRSRPGRPKKESRASE